MKKHSKIVLAVVGLVVVGIGVVILVCPWLRSMMKENLGPKGATIDAKVLQLRGLEGVSPEIFVPALLAGDADKIAQWYAAALGVVSNGSPEVVELSQKDQLSSANLRAHAPVTPASLARTVAILALKEQIGFRSDLSRTPDTATMIAARKKIYLLQFIADEALALASHIDTNSLQVITVSGPKLVEEELSHAGSVLGLAVISGDILIQLSSHALSSEFIAHSQSDPGVASHSALIVSTDKAVVKMEALIEDGVNLRAITPATENAEIAQIWVVGLKGSADRARAAEATKNFAAKHQLPFTGPGQPEQLSPLKYDATMDPKMMAQGAYYCTTLLEQIYLDTKLGNDKVPFRPDESNWTNLNGIEAEVYRTLSITRTKVAAPSDVFINSEFEVRGTALLLPAVIEARRLHAAVDSIFFTFEHDVKLKESLLHELVSLPDINLDKQKTLAILDKALKIARDKNLISEKELTRVNSIREKILADLPQHATLRQVVFFYYMNNILQARMLTQLEQFENSRPNQFATALELRTAAARQLSTELARASSVLKIVNTLVPR